MNMHYLPIPREVMVTMNEGSEKDLFKQRLTIRIQNTKIEWSGAFVGLGDGNGYITLSNARMKKAGLRPGDIVPIELEKDESAYGMPVPAELAVILAIDSNYQRLFDQLKPGMQRYILYYVDGVKSPEKREERALMLMNNLEKHKEKKITFRLLLGKED